MHDAEIKIREQEKAIQAGSKPQETDHPTIGPIGWMLVWQEYARKKRQFQFIGEHGLRSKTDEIGQRWHVHSKLPQNVAHPNESLREVLLKTAETFGYDIDNPPHDDFILLTCQPASGQYNVAQDTIQRIRERLPSDVQRWDKLNRELEVLEKAGDTERVERTLSMRQEVATEIQKARANHAECVAIIENAVTRQYLIPMESLSNMDSYGMPIKCLVVGIPPQKRMETVAIPDAILEDA